MATLRHQVIDQEIVDETIIHDTDERRSGNEFSGIIVRITHPLCINSRDYLAINIMMYEDRMHAQLQSPFVASSGLALFVDSTLH